MADEVIDYASDDARMNAAMERARVTLPAFDEALKDARVAGVQLNVGLPYGTKGLHEYVWVVDIRRNGDGSYDGTIDNDLIHIPTLHKGAPLHVDRASVADWLYSDAKGDHGGYTLRLMIEDMTPEQRRLQDRHFVD